MFVWFFELKYKRLVLAGRAKVQTAPHMPRVDHHKCGQIGVDSDQIGLSQNAGISKINNAVLIGTY